MSKEQKKIGRYSVLKSIGRGGMGEVFLAYDPVCERNVALKCIREDLREKKLIKSRFLREARIASQLTHPSILPIYTIHSDPTNLYYTMSYIEGETLREILRKTKEQEKKGLELHPIGGSIAALCRIFLSVCEAAAYTHSRRILHRDFKPENIIIGKYGEVMILDWGIADFFSEEKKPEMKKGKVAGTVAYMAPERALGEPATRQTDIYSLGVILYQILTLELPFRRGNLEAFRKSLKDEEWVDPIEVAPYREIPHELIQIVKKCLCFSPKDRYKRVEDLIEDLKNTIEGKPDWIFTASLDPKKKSDWEFQENILLTKHTAITRNIDVMEWVGLMVSKETFSGNIRLEAKLHIPSSGSGIGFLLGIPEMPKRRSLEEGYCLWIGDSLQLFRSNVLVIDESNVKLERDKWHHLKIEKANDHVRFFLDEETIFTYNSHLPLSGAHVGLLHKDTDFEIKDLNIYSGTHNVMVNCLAIPDAFFAHKDYETALTEYRRIGRSFPGRAEGRDAFFKAGITLLEKAKTLKENQRTKFYSAALDEFESLHGTPGAPLEYLGKAFVYKELHDHEEEAKCLEFALRKFPKHPLLPILEEHIIYRMHESAGLDRESAYRLILLVIWYFPKTLKDRDTKSLTDSLQKHWEKLPFIERSPGNDSEGLAIILAFWANKKLALTEFVKTLLKKKPIDQINAENALICLAELGAYTELKSLLDDIKSLSMKKEYQREISLIKCTLFTTDSALRHLFELSSKKLSRKETRVLHHILKKMLIREEYAKIRRVFEFLQSFSIPKEDKIHLDALFLWNTLLEKDYKKSEEVISNYPKSVFEDDNTPLFSPFGSYLFLRKGPEKAKKHFSHSVEKTFPPTTSLLSHYLHGNIDLKEWKAFFWEKQELYRSLTLFYRSIDKKTMPKHLRKKSMQDLPEIIEKKYVHRGFFDLRIDTIKRKDLEPINYTVLLTKVESVSVLAQDREGRYILAKEYRHPIRKYVLSLPGGRCEKEESHEVTAQREFLEETGYEAPFVRLLEKYYPMPSVCDQKILLYYAENCEKAKDADLDSFEIIETVLMSEKELMEELKKGAEIDGVLAAALFYKNLSK